MPKQDGTGEGDPRPAADSIASTADAAAARAAIEAALARRGETVRAPFWRAVDRCYAAPYRLRRRDDRPEDASDIGEATRKEIQMRHDASSQSGGPAAPPEPRHDPLSGLRGSTAHPPCGPPPLDNEPRPAPALPPHSPATAGPSAAPPHPSAHPEAAIPPFGPPRLETEPEIAPRPGPHSPASSGMRGRSRDRRLEPD